MASKRGAFVLRNKDQCWGSGLYCTLYARTSFWHCQSCGVEAYIGKPISECAVCMFQRLESAKPGDGCQCTNSHNGGNRQLILETRAAQWRANITQNFAGNYIGLPQTVSGPIRAAWDQQEAELRAQQRPAASQQLVVAQQYPAAPQQPLPLVPPPSKAPPPPSSTPAAPAPPQHPSSTSSSTSVAQQHPAVPHALPLPSAVLAPPPGLLDSASRPPPVPPPVPDSDPKPTWLAERSGNYSGIPGHPTFEPQLQTLVEHLQAAAQAIGDHVATLGEKVAAMETESESEASTVVKKFDDINLCLQELNQKVTSVVGLHGSIDEMQKKYAEMKSALEAMEEREQATSKRLNRAIRAIRRNEMPSSGSGGSDSLSLSTEAAVADAEDSGATRQDPPLDDMESSGVVVKHEKGYQFGATTFVKMSENHVSDTH